jgi:hypothetical protein
MLTTLEKHQLLPLDMPLSFALEGRAERPHDYESAVNMRRPRHMIRPQLKRCACRVLLERARSRPDAASTPIVDAPGTSQIPQTRQLARQKAAAAIAGLGPEGLSAVRSGRKGAVLAGNREIFVINQTLIYGWRSGRKLRFPRNTLKDFA